MEKHTYVGKTEEEALEEAYKDLNVTNEDIMFSSNEQKGGLFKSKKVEIEVIKKSDIHDFIKETILSNGLPINNIERIRWIFNNKSDVDTKESIVKKVLEEKV